MTLKMVCTKAKKLKLNSNNANENGFISHQTFPDVIDIARQHK